MVDVRVLLDYVKVLFKEINWVITSLSQKYYITRLSSAEAKSSFSSAA